MPDRQAVSPVLDAETMAAPTPTNSTIVKANTTTVATPQKVAMKRLTPRKPRVRKPGQKSALSLSFIVLSFALRELS